MDQKKIDEIRKDIESYKRAIEDAEGALQEAERELDEALQEEELPWDSEPPAEEKPADFSIRIDISVNGIKVSSRTITVSPDEAEDEETPF